MDADVGRNKAAGRVSAARRAREILFAMTTVSPGWQSLVMCPAVVTVAAVVRSTIAQDVSISARLWDKFCRLDGQSSFARPETRPDRFRVAVERSRPVGWGISGRSGDSYTGSTVR